MDIEKLERVIALLKGTDFSEFVLEEEGSTLKIARTLGVYQVAPREVIAPVHYADTATVVTAVVEDPAQIGLHKVESPIVGTFYGRPSPDAEPYIKIGDRVKVGEKLCIVEAMKLMNEIESPVTGVVERVCLNDGQVVEYGEVLFLIRPD